LPNDVSIKKYIDDFQNDLKSKNNIPCFDHCYNYFYSFYEKGNTRDIANDKNLQISCLQLGFYLANMGMMRGSTVLKKKSLEYLVPLVELISISDPFLWKLDIDSYSGKNIEILLKLKKSIETKLIKPTDTLTTKIMLGVYGNIPAFDTYFRKGFKGFGFKVNTVDEHSLSNIRIFYDKHKQEIDSIEIFTRDFPKGAYTKTKYTKARLIDMCGFQKGKG
jgi:hypothetical protein